VGILRVEVRASTRLVSYF